MEKIARFPGGEKGAESCHVSGCHGFFGPEKCESNSLFMPKMTGQPGCRTMEMNGGSSTSCLARNACVPSFLCFVWWGVEPEGLSDYQQRAAIRSIVQWNFRCSYSVSRLDKFGMGVRKSWLRLPLQSLRCNSLYLKTYAILYDSREVGKFCDYDCHVHRQIGTTK